MFFTELAHVVQVRAEGPKAPSPGHRPGEGTEKVKSTFRLKVNGGEIVVLPFFFCLT